MLITLIRILPEIERNGDLAEHIARRAARASATRCRREAAGSSNAWVKSLR